MNYIVHRSRYFIRVCILPMKIRLVTIGEGDEIADSQSISV